MKTETLLEKLFENSTSLLLVTDENFNIRYISSSVTSSFGLEPYSVVGRNAFDFVNEDNREAWKQCLAETNFNMRSDISLVTAEGKELHFDATVTNHFSNSEIRGLVVMMYDITETKKKRKLLEKTNHHLDHFIYKTIHDLKAPVQSALSLIALGKQSDPAEREEHFSMVKSNLEKMNSFIDEVSSYYKNEKLGLVKELIDFDELFSQEKQLLQNLPGADKIVFDYSYAGSKLVSDPMRIKTILTNILSNSIKYSDPLKPQRFVKVSAEADENSCEITIQDNGLGIRGEHQEKIFDIFFRSHPHIQGTGLGLYIVKDTVNRLGGTIQLKSEYGVGTTFVITVPNLIADDVPVL